MIGTLHEFAFEASPLVGNPLTDPAERSLLVYVPPHPSGQRLPAVYFLHGFSGSGAGWKNVSAFQPTVPERIDLQIAKGTLPPFLAVFPDGFTSLGGTQWTDAPAVGRYQTYVAEAVVKEVEERFDALPLREARAVLGKSSGGYGALRMGRDRPDVFAHVACHSGDSYFEYCYLQDIPKAAGALLGAPSPEAWLEDFRRRAYDKKPRGDDFAVVNILAMAAHYSPQPGSPLGFELPFELPSGRMREAVWKRWLEEDPVRYVPRSLDAYRKLSTIFLDCGTRDEFHLRWGARMVAEILRSAGVEVTHEEFEDGHMGINYRYDSSLALIAPRLARS